MIGRLFSRRGSGMATSTARRNPEVCLQVLGLSERPFREVRHGFLLARSETAGSALEQVLAHCRAGAGEVLLVTPQVAEIQRPLSNLLAHALEEEFLVVGIQADLLMSAEEVLERIAEGVSAATGQALGADDLLAGLYDFLTGDENGGIVVQVEDAHELGAEVIDVLLDLSAEPALGGALRLVLWGESYLWESLEYLLAERGMPGARVDIPPFSREDISDYLEHCLVECGYKGDFPFSETQMEKIFLESRCVPHMIDALADDELEAIARAPRTHRRRGVALPLPHALAAGVLLAALGVLYVWQDVDFSLPSASLPVADAGTRRVVVPIDTSRVTAAAPATVATSTEARPAPSASRNTAAALPASETSTALETSTEGAFAGDGPAAADGVSGGLSDGAAAANAGMPTSPVTASPADGPTATPALELAEAANVLPALSTASPGTVAEAQASAGIRTPLEESQARLRALPAEHYFLQLMGTFSEQSARDFIASNGGGDRFHYFQSEYQGRPWYVVVYGGFATRQQATGAAQSLPEALSATTPWIRTGEEIRLAMVD